MPEGDDKDGTQGYVGPVVHVDHDGVHVLGLGGDYGAALGIARVLLDHFGVEGIEHGLRVDLDLPHPRSMPTRKF